MSGKPSFTADALQAALGTGRAPATLDRTARVRLIGEAAQALLAGRLPERESALFLGGALMSWLSGSNSDLVKDHFKITRPKSHITPQRLWRLIDDERQDSGTGNRLPTSPRKREADES